MKVTLDSFALYSLAVGSSASHPISGNLWTPEVCDVDDWEAAGQGFPGQRVRSFDSDDGGLALFPFATAASRPVGVEGKGKRNAMQSIRKGEKRSGSRSVMLHS